ncbi:MAG: hypothetical protein HQM14_13710 [SAR324 cluster bacterium]|nr:hypothetical protein [SAR324 cluster bacterium]
MDIFGLEWFIQNVLYEYSTESLIVLGIVSLCIGSHVLRQLIHWLRYSRDKKKVIEQIQQHLFKK